MPAQIASTSLWTLCLFLVDLWVFYIYLEFKAICYLKVPMLCLALQYAFVPSSMWAAEFVDFDVLGLISIL